jgi:aquaporin Z
VKQWQRYLAELFGTFVLVAGGSTAIIAVLKSYSAGPYSTTSYSGVNALELIIPWGFGLSLLAGLYMFAEVSGGHFNPALSLAAFLDRRLNFEDLLGYWIFQFAGAIMASLLLLVPFDHDLVKATATVPSSNGTALFLEIAFTAIFALVFLHATKSDKFGLTALLAIPLTLIMIHFALVPFSGASVNPARSLGPALVGDEWKSFWIYIIGPSVGAIIGWLIYAIVIKGDTDFRDDMRALRQDIKPSPKAEPEPPAAAN